ILSVLYALDTKDCVPLAIFFPFVVHTIECTSYGRCLERVYGASPCEHNGNSRPIGYTCATALPGPAGVSHTTAMGITGRTLTNSVLIDRAGHLLLCPPFCGMLPAWPCTHS